MEYLALIIPAFIAGLLTFLAPCTLPLLPGYLAFISGVSVDELKDKEKAKAARKKIFLNGLFFIAGFTLIFVLFGSLAGFFGYKLAIYRIWLSRFGGILIILFGLFMLGALRIPFLEKGLKIKLPSFLKIGKPTTSLAAGSAFAFGWTPCVGPILGAILTFTAASATALEGTFLLFIFSIGLAIPFLAVAIGFSRATEYITKTAKYLKVISVIGGIFLIFLGILLLTNRFGLLIQYGYQLFDFIDYDRLLDYL